MRCADAEPVGHAWQITHLLHGHFFFQDAAATGIYALSLHDALPICPAPRPPVPRALPPVGKSRRPRGVRDRKSTRLNSSHGYISYAVFCLKQKTLPVLETSRRSARTRCVAAPFCSCRTGGPRLAHTP